MLKAQEKEKIIKEHKLHDIDTGSPEVQIALFSKEIDRLASHLKKHPKDIHSKRGLLKMISKRRSLFKYLQQEDEARYDKAMKKLGLGARKQESKKA